MFFSGSAVKLYFIIATMSALVCYVIIENTYNYGTGGFFSAKSNFLELQSAGKISHCVMTAELLTEWSQQNLQVNKLYQKEVESIFLDPYPLRIGHYLDIYINVSLSKTII